MKTIQLIGALLLVSIFFACEDSLTKDYPELKTYFVKDRVQERNIYDLTVAGIDKETYEIAMQCSGAENISVKGKIRINEERLEEFNKYNSTSFVPMPANVYTVLNNEVHFDSKKNAGIFEVEIDIRKLADEVGYGELNYVIPVELYESGTIEVNTSKNYLLIKPNLFAPYVEMEATGTKDVILGKGESANLTIPVSLPFETPVDVTFDFIVDQDVLDVYNEENGTFLELFPAGNYELLTDNLLIGKGEKSLVAEFLLNDNGLTFGTYALPVKLVNIDPFPTRGETTVLYIITYLPEEISSANWGILQGNEFTSQTDGQGIPGLLDGNPNTYWQATGAYLDKYEIIFDMKAIYEISRFEVIRRGNVSGNGTTFTDVQIEVSEDGKTWTSSEILRTTYMPGVWQGQNIDPLKGRYLKYVHIYNTSRHMAAFRIRGEKAE